MYSSSFMLSFLLFFSIPCLCLSSLHNSSAYELLESFGFPTGLLPETVVDYSLLDDGSFALYLDGSCAVDIPDAYPVRYSSKIAGSVSYGRLSDLSGISVKVFYVWWDISNISLSGDDLVFKVGPASASYPAENFVENPVCEGSTSGKPSRAQIY